MAVFVMERFLTLGADGRHGEKGVEEQRLEEIKEKRVSRKWEGDGGSDSSDAYEQ